MTGKHSNQFNLLKYHFWANNEMVLKIKEGGRGEYIEGRHSEGRMEYIVRGGELKLRGGWST